MKYTDLPTDPEDVIQDAESFFTDKIEDLADEDADQGDDSPHADILIILSQQDPVELVTVPATIGEGDLEAKPETKEPRWTPLQQKIILEAKSIVDSWS